jgi:hypothetical protein
MAILSVLAAPMNGLSKGINYYTANSGAFVVSQGSYAQQEISSLGAFVDGDTLTIAWGAESVVLTYESNLSTVNNLLNHGILFSNTNSMMAETMRRNRKLSDAFDIQQTPASVLVMARRKGVEFSMTITSTAAIGLSGVAGTDMVLNDDLRALFYIYRKLPGILAEQLIAMAESKFELIGVNNAARIDMKRYLATMVDVEDLNNVVFSSGATPTPALNSMAEYRLMVAENEDDVKMFEFPGLQQIVRGGVSLTDGKAYFGNNPLMLFKNEGLFITNKGDVMVVAGQRESLAFYTGVVNTNTFYRGVLRTNGDETTDAAITGGVADSQLSNWIHFVPAGPNELLLNLSPGEFYTVRIQRTTDEGETWTDWGPEKKFTFIERPANCRIFTFENALGRFDSVMVKSQVEYRFEVERDEIEKVFPFWDYTLETVSVKSNRVAVKDEFTGFIGGLSKDEVIWLREFLQSEHIWLQDETAFEKFFNPVVLEKGSFRIWRDDDFNYGVSIRWRFARREQSASAIKFF